MEPIIESEVKEFVKRLPNINDEEPTVHLTMMAIRSRLMKEIVGQKSKDFVVERKIIKPKSAWRTDYVERVYNIGVLQQNAVYRYKELDIPPKARGIFGTLGPRSVKHAIKDINGYIIENLMTEMNTKQNIKTNNPLELDNNESTNNNNSWGYALTKLETEFFGRLHAHKSSKSPKLVTVDVDDAVVFDEVNDMLSSFKHFMTTRTSRGYHITKELDTDQAGRDFYQPAKANMPGGVWPRINEKFNNGEKDKVEIKRDISEPIPGTFYFSNIRDNNYVTILV